jgi:CheY-like chemotaxis protein
MATVLIVDDDPDVLGYATLVLETNGHKTVRAARALEALMLYASYADRFDLVLTDVDMPEMNGIELASRISRSNPSAKILLMTGALPRDLPIPECQPVLSKPFQPDALIAAVKELLARDPAP